MSADDRTTRLICPNHPTEPPSARRYLYEMEDDDATVECLSDGCDYACQNFVKYPVAQVVEFSTGKIRLKNVMTGEYLS